jgi:putative ABC transport system permease protein
MTVYPYAIAFGFSFLAGCALRRWHRALSFRWMTALLRGSVQLLALSWVLRPIFSAQSYLWLVLAIGVMVATAAFAAIDRLPEGAPGTGRKRFGAVVVALVLACLPFSILAGLLGSAGGVPETTWAERVIPFTGLLLGNALSGISLGLSRWSVLFTERREEIEALRSWGATPREQFWRYLREPMELALTPTLNALAVAGVVSIPGMMSGQLLAGVPPLRAALMQILLFSCLLISTAVGTFLAIAFSPRPKAWAEERFSSLADSAVELAETRRRLLDKRARIAFYGPSGEGKSTYLRALSREAPIDLRLCAQKPWLPDESLSKAILRFSRSIAAQKNAAWRNESWIRETLRALLHSGSASRILDEGLPLARLSGGEAQVVQLVLSAASPARALLLDEPTAPMDAELRERVEKFLLGLPHAWILVTHDRAQAARLCDEVLAFSRPIPASAPPREIGA